MGQKAPETLQKLLRRAARLNLVSFFTANPQLPFLNPRKIILRQALDKKWQRQTQESRSTLFEEHANHPLAWP